MIWYIQLQAQWSKEGKLIPSLHYCMTMALVHHTTLWESVDLHAAVAVLLLVSCRLLWPHGLMICPTLSYSISSHSLRELQLQTVHMQCFTAAQGSRCNAALASRQCRLYHSIDSCWCQRRPGSINFIQNVNQCGWFLKTKYQTGCWQLWMRKMPTLARLCTYIYSVHKVCH